MLEHVAGTRPNVCKYCFALMLVAIAQFFNNRGYAMPTISMFYGIIISMFFEIKEKHHLPHIHVRYQGYKASVAIEGATLLAG